MGNFSAVFLDRLLTMTASDSVESAAPSEENKSGTRWLVVDFDGTCTERETPSLLPKLASELNGDDSLEKRVVQFKEFEDEYYRLYKAAKERISPDTMTLEEALDSLDDVSNLVTEHVSASGVLQGLNVPPKDILELIESDEEVRDYLKLHSDCLQVLARYAVTEWQLGILSINWSPSLIHATVVQPLQRLIEGKEVDVPIWSNTIDANGIVSLKVPGALAKKACIARLRPAFVVYVGDSSTDILALLEADVGILMGKCNSAVAMAERWGIQVLPLSQHQRERTSVNCYSTSNQPEDSAKVIWMAESWHEIDLALKAFQHGDDSL